MARHKHSAQPVKVPIRPAPPPPEYSLHPRLYEGMESLAEKGDWEGWVHLALETGDPKFWPHIRRSYRDEPKWRWMILFHLRIYWREYEAMVAPLFREALRDPEHCEMAIEAAEEFPSLSEDVVAALRDPECLRRVGMIMGRDVVAQAALCLQEHPAEAVVLLREALQGRGCARDPDCARAALYLAAAFPALTDDVVACLKDTEFVRRVGIDPLLGCFDIHRSIWYHCADMPRTTLDIDACVLREIRALQETEGRSMGQNVSALLAEALAWRQGAREAPRLTWVSQPMHALVDLTDKEGLSAVLDSDSS